MAIFLNSILFLLKVERGKFKEINLENWNKWTGMKIDSLKWIFTDISIHLQLTVDDLLSKPIDEEGLASLFSNLQEIVENSSFFSQQFCCLLVLCWFLLQFG